MVKIFFSLLKFPVCKKVRLKVNAVGGGDSYSLYRSRSWPGMGMRDPAPFHIHKGLTAMSGFKRFEDIDIHPGS